MLASEKRGTGQERKARRRAAAGADTMPRDGGFGKPGPARTVLDSVHQLACARERRLAEAGAAVLLVDARLLDQESRRPPRAPDPSLPAPPPGSARTLPLSSTPSLA